jgi:hypothetical protein
VEQVSINLTMTTTASQRGNISGTFITNTNTSNNNTLTTNGIASNLFTVYPTGVIQNNGGTVTSTAATLVFDNNGTYVHNRDGGAIPAATWYNAVGPLISNVSGYWLRNNSTYRKTLRCLEIIPGTVLLLKPDWLTWECLQLLFMETLPSFFYRFRNQCFFNNGGAGTIQVNGDFLLQGGDVLFNNSGASVVNLNLAGNYNQTGGSLQRGAGTGIQNINFNNAAVNRTYSNSGTFTSTGINVSVLFEMLS